MNANKEYFENSNLAELHQQEMQSPELSFFDLWIILVLRKKLALSIIIVCVLAGVGYVMTIKKFYEYSATIEIGTKYVKNEPVLIDAVETVRSTIDTKYIPLLVQQYKNEPEKLAIIRRARASVIGGSAMIKIAVGGVEEGNNSAFYVIVLNEIVSMIKEEHKRLLSTAGKKEQMEKQNLIREMNTFIAKRDITEDKRKRLQELKKTLHKEIGDAEVLLNSMIADKQKIIKFVQGNASSMALVMQNQAIIAQQNNLNNLHNKLHIQIESEYEDVLRELVDYKAAIEKQKNEISGFDSILDGMKLTRIIQAPEKNLESGGKSVKTIILLSFAMGIVLSVFAVFLLELLARTKKKIQKIQLNGN